MLLKYQLEEMELNRLKPYACFSNTASRNIELTGNSLRTEFQRDRDRIIHSKAFRRLEYKTQVYLTSQGDHLRTRLTHSLEVSQLSRTICNQLGLNCDLAEAISLGHDLGHTPFGHAGERELRKLLESDGIKTFKHNTQSVKIIDLLEKKYNYNGLNLTLPVREGILKHTKLPEEVPENCQDLNIGNTCSFTLEGQVVAIADEIAQVTHDMDDYLRRNVIRIEEFLDYSIFDIVRCFHQDQYKIDLKTRLEDIPDITRRKDTLIRCFIDCLVYKLIEESEKKVDDNLRAYNIDKEYIGFRRDFKVLIDGFHDYLNNIIFSDTSVYEMDKYGSSVINTLFNFYKNHPEPPHLPIETYKKYKQNEAAGFNPLIVVADYISGMTDRYAIEQVGRIETTK